MRYPIAVELGDEQHAFGVVVPDIPGCQSAGDTMDEAIENAIEAIKGHLSVLADTGEDIPLAKAVQMYVAQPEFAGWVWAMADIDISQFMGKAEKINITLPGRLIRKIDELVARDPRYKSRSGLLANAAERVLADANKAA